MWNLKRNDTNEFTYKTEKDSQTQKMNSWLPVGRHSYGLWEGHAHTTIFKMDNQQKPIVQHMELCSMSCASLNGRRTWGRMDTCICIRIRIRIRICMAESLHCSPETITVLLISYTPIQTAFGVRKKKKINIINKIIFQDGKHHCRK